ncbi:MAG: guanylate kinase [Clostridia bacterium]|nr:guanylate kinase [Clostridia bacterium]
MENTNVKPGLLLVVSGPSGVGKGTIDGQLLKKHENMVLSVSCTTRGPRPGEIDGVHYSFISQERFEEMIREDAFLEYMHVFGMNYYGTPAEPVFRQMAEGKDVLLEIDVQGAMRVKEKYPQAVLVFIAPPSLEELRNRLVGRGTETPEAIEKRLNTVRAELQRLKDYDYMVLNDTVEQAVERMEAILTAEKCKVNNNLNLAETLMKE